MSDAVFQALQARARLRALVTHVGAGGADNPVAGVPSHHHVGTSPAELGAGHQQAHVTRGGMLTPHPEALATGRHAREGAGRAGLRALGPEWGVGVAVGVVV